MVDLFLFFKSKEHRVLPEFSCSMPFPFLIILCYSIVLAFLTGRRGVGRVITKSLPFSGVCVLKHETCRAKHSRAIPYIIIWHILEAIKRKMDHFWYHLKKVKGNATLNSSQYKLVHSIIIIFFFFFFYLNHNIIKKYN